MAKKKVSKKKVSKKPSRSAIKPARTRQGRTAAKAPKSAGSGRSQAADWQQLTAADIMQRDVVTVTTSMPLSEVEQVLSENRITGVPVTDEAGHIVGVLSARDLMERHTQEPEGAQQERGLGYFSVTTNELEEEDLEAFVPAAGSASEATAGEVMTAQVFTVSADAGLRKVAGEMVKHGIHRVLVHQANRTVGIISTTDLLRVMAK
jgi:CBS domain-containing protein